MTAFSSGIFLCFLNFRGLGAGALILHTLVVVWDSGKWSYLGKAGQDGSVLAMMIYPLEDSQVAATGE